MKHHLAFSRIGLFILALAALGLPSLASAALIDYTAVIYAVNGGGSNLGYVTADPNYWTPELGNAASNGIVVSFTLNGTSGTQINLATVQNTNENAFPDLGLVQGRDNSSADIGAGNYNYLYLDNTNATAPNSTPQHPGNYFSASTGNSYASESAVWSIDITGTTGTLVPVWVNSDGTTPNTETFIQSNHVYAGGDANAFHTRFPAPVTSVTLDLDILSAVPETVATPEPASFGTLALGLLGAGMLWRGRRSKSR